MKRASQQGRPQWAWAIWWWCTCTNFCCDVLLLQAGLCLLCQALYFMLLCLLRAAALCFGQDWWHMLCNHFAAPDLYWLNPILALAVRRERVSGSIVCLSSLNLVFQTNGCVTGCVRWGMMMLRCVCVCVCVCRLENLLPAAAAAGKQTHLTSPNLLTRAKADLIFTIKNLSDLNEQLY